MTPHSKSAPAPGTLIAGKFKVRGVLGVGGMSVVVEADHMNLCVPVALKLLARSKRRSSSRISRFHQEARIIAALTSEHVPKVMDIGVTENGDHFVVMERLRGHDLSKELEIRGPLPIVVAIEYILQACQPLAEMHALGLVHRDIKPANLFLAEPGLGRPPMIKLLDFGLSKAGGLSLTLTATRLGTPTYMSPEQLRSSKHVDGRSDQFSLALVLYELLTNQSAFPGPEIAAIAQQILTQPPRPMREVEGEVPIELEQIIFRALAKDPAHRFMNVYELARALADFGGDAAKSLLPTIQAALQRREPSAEPDQYSLPRLNFSEDSSHSEHSRRVPDNDDAETAIMVPRLQPNAFAKAVPLAEIVAPRREALPLPEVVAPHREAAPTRRKRSRRFDTRALWWLSLLIASALAAGLVYSLLRP